VSEGDGEGARVVHCLHIDQVYSLQRTASLTRLGATSDNATELFSSRTNRLQIASQRQLLRIQQHENNEQNQDADVDHVILPSNPFQCD
jgi:hypothetical protein